MLNTLVCLRTNPDEANITTSFMYFGVNRCTSVLSIVMFLFLCAYTFVHIYSSYYFVSIFVIYLLMVCLLSFYKKLQQNYFSYMYASNSSFHNTKQRLLFTNQVYEDSLSLTPIEADLVDLFLISYWLIIILKSIIFVWRDINGIVWENSINFLIKSHLRRRNLIQKSELLILYFEDLRHFSAMFNIAYELGIPQTTTLLPVSRT